MDIKESIYADVKPDVWKRLNTIFLAGFPEEKSLRHAVPSPREDVVYIAYGKNGDVSGFVMVHPSPPYKFDIALMGDSKLADEKQAYMMNLAVDQSRRKTGVASALLAHVQAKYPLLTCHMPLTSPHGSWFVKRGWVALAPWRGVYREYAVAKTKILAQPKLQEAFPLDNYDPEEGIVYMS